MPSEGSKTELPWMSRAEPKGRLLFSSFTFRWKASGKRDQTPLGISNLPELPSVTLFPPGFGFSLSLGRPTLSKATPQQLLDGRRVPRDVSILWAATLSSTKMGKMLLLGPAIPCPKCWRKMKFWGFFLSDSSEAVDSCCGSKCWDISRTFRGVIPRVHRLSKPFGMSNPISRNAEGKGIWQPFSCKTARNKRSRNISVATTSSPPIESVSGIFQPC